MIALSASKAFAAAFCYRSWNVEKLPGVQLSQQESLELQNVGMLVQEAKVEQLEPCMPRSKTTSS